ncbi:hypothetical protein [Brucella sp. IR073]|uniref:hypothetical protein n=1 Tax=unclassified Brucella TaxID=2632610 RepID=UPI003B983B54
MTGNSSFPTFRDMILIEDDPALFAVTCERTGIPYWALIRNVVFRAMMSDFFYDAPIPPAGASRRVSAKAIVTLAKGTAHNIRSRASVPDGICIMASGMGLQIRNGRWFNRLCDHFALAAPAETLVIEEGFRWNWPFPRVFEQVAFHAPYQVAGELSGRVLARSSHRKKAAEIIAIAARRAKEQIGWSPPQSRIAQIEKTLARRAAAAPFMYSMYRQMLRATGAKLLLKEEGCYSRSAVTVAAARSLGIHVAEYQHGMISSGHDSYNFAPAAIANEALRRCLPDTLLCYGDWWAEQVNAPVEKISIGNPHREDVLTHISQPARKETFLVIGNGIETQRYMGLAVKLAEGLGGTGVKVVFRPHPFERASVAETAHLYPTVEIDTRADIYQSLADARFVISEVSTALFEAVGLADCIFVWDTPKSRSGLPNHPFIDVADAEDIIRRVCGNDVSGNKCDEDAIWAKNWRENYRSFLTRQGVAVHGR